MTNPIPLRGGYAEKIERGRERDGGERKRWRDEEERCYSCVNLLGMWECVDSRREDERV